MRKQIRLLQRTDWNVLIILDACRGDYFARFAGPGEIVRSAAVCTTRWVHAVIGAGAIRGPLVYFNANPVVTRELINLGGPGKFGIREVQVWDHGWSKVGPKRIPTVHPGTVTHEVVRFLEGRNQPARMVVHYVQPHSPYIGDTPLAVGRSGQFAHELGKACRRLPRPDRLAADGKLDWALLRQAYVDNLRLVWTWTKWLMHHPLIKGKVVVTSDHGEVLGEHGGEFGHECHWRYDELWRVPWLEFDCGELVPRVGAMHAPPDVGAHPPSVARLLRRTGGGAPASAPEAHRPGGDDQTMHDRLRALGYE